MLAYRQQIRKVWKLCERFLNNKIIERRLNMYVDTIWDGEMMKANISVFGREITVHYKLGYTHDDNENVVAIHFEITELLDGQLIIPMTGEKTTPEDQKLAGEILRMFAKLHHLPLNKIGTIKFEKIIELIVNNFSDKGFHWECIGNV